MQHQTSLIAIIVIGLGLAFVFGTIAHRFKISPLVGYLLAGVGVGPFTPGYVADQALADQLAEIGVILLMFGVGLHFSLKDLLSVRRIVFPGATVQVIVSTALGIGAAHWIGWPLGAGIVFGLALSVASTVVVLRALTERHLLNAERGHIAMGWLVFQDMLMVLVLVLLPPLAGLLSEHPAGGAATFNLGELALSIAITIGKVALFIAIMLVIGKRWIPAILHYIAHTGSRELFRLAVLAIALGVAFSAAEWFGVSFALGAFFAGMVLSESALSQQAAEETLPLRDAFAVLFFVSVGMLFNPSVLIHEPLALLISLAVVMIGGAGTALLMVRGLGYPLATALLVGACLAQIGEFSFILADLGIGLGMLPESARDLILGTAIVSILVNPLLFLALDRMKHWFELHLGQPAHPVPEPPPLEATTLAGHAVLIGYGRVGRLVGDDLAQAGWPLFVIEDSIETVAVLRERNIEAIAGNAASRDVLATANLAQARILLVAIPNAFEACEIVKEARAINPGLEIVARAHFDAEVEQLRDYGANTVIMGEREIARTMIEHVRSLA